jgi:predicted RNA-binding Zn-ribbon protein involved in translation (DUF1610 family)
MAAANTHTTDPVFKHCVRCGYALRGLPATHACPECGLRYDPRCALYRVTNPRQLIAFWLMILAGGWVSLRNLPKLARLDSASTWDIVGVVAAVVWIVFIIAGTWWLLRSARRGFKVAITTDMLVLHVPGSKRETVPWSDIESVAVKPLPEGKPQIATVKLRIHAAAVEVGGVANVFPRREDVERFVAEANARIAAAKHPVVDEAGNGC